MYVSDYLAFFWTDFNAVFSIIFFSDLGEGFRDLIKKMEAKENWVGSFFLKGGTFFKAQSIYQVVPTCVIIFMQRKTFW